MELLAPVGSKESFVTALRAGASAVYIGVPDFNARVSASNINLFDLKVLISHAHEKGVKVYLALNTLVKHEEIHAVVKNIAFIEKLSPDGVIVQDLGIAGIIQKYYPGLELHASTQLVVHNRQGVDFLARNGFKRAILARELSFAELKIIANGSPIGIEVFVHGALCFSLSGMCLFSSFIGGLSGNRGRCTQPCRRLWRGGGKKGYLFSPRDLELAEHVGKLKSIGIKALKIEGRMRSSEYVFRTVKAYRMLIDAPEAEFPAVLKEAKLLLSGDMAREKTSCLFSGRDNDMFQPGKAQCLGNLVGSIANVSGGNLTVEAAAGAEIALGDRLRLTDPAKDHTVAFKVKEFSMDGAKYVIPFGKAGEFVCGNPVYKTVDTAFDQKDIEKDLDSIYEDYKKANPRPDRGETNASQDYTALISNKWKENKKAILPVETGETLWVKFDDMAWLDVLPSKDKNTRFVFNLTKENLHSAEKIQRAAAANIAGELPPFIGQRDLPVFKQCVDKMASAGVSRWVLNNVSHFGFFESNENELTAGPFLYTWNAYTAAFYADLGIKYFTVSWEDDFLNIRKVCSPGLGRHLVVYLYGYAPVARSRLIAKEMLGEGLISDCSETAAERKTSEGGFKAVFESGLAVLVPEKPFSIFNARKKLSTMNVSNFGIDLSYITPDRKIWDEIFAAYTACENTDNTVKFNFKRAVK